MTSEFGWEDDENKLIDIFETVETQSENMDDEWVDAAAELSPDELYDQQGDAPVLVKSLTGSTGITRLDPEAEMAGLQEGLKAQDEMYQGVLESYTQSLSEAYNNEELSNAERIELLQQGKQNLENLKAEWDKDRLDVLDMMNQVGRNAGFEDVIETTDDSALDSLDADLADEGLDEADFWDDGHQEDMNESTLDDQPDEELTSEIFEVETADGPATAEVSEWLGDVNPNYDAFDIDSPYSNNCGSCALTVQEHLDGNHDTTASETNIGTIEEMNSLTQMEQVSMSPEQIEQNLLESGDGSHAIIGIDRAEGPGHWFNAANINGKVYAIDGQTGEISDWPPDYGNVTNWDMSVRKE